MWIMSELAVTTLTFCTALDFLQLCYSTRVMLLQNLSYRFRSFMVIIMNSWIVTVYPSAPWEPVCSMCHSFLSSFVYSGLDSLWATRRVFQEKQRTLTQPVHLVNDPNFSGVQVSHLLLFLCTCYFGHFMFFILYICFLLLVFVLGLHSFNFG